MMGRSLPNTMSTELEQRQWKGRQLKENASDAVSGNVALTDGEKKGRAKRIDSGFTFHF